MEQFKIVEQEDGTYLVIDTETNKSMTKNVTDKAIADEICEAFNDVSNSIKALKEYEQSRKN